MAKISPTSIKYSIIADFESEGPLEKPDVIGALFGQTEGLLGADMELRELQKEGKIGRIDVNLTTENGKTKGEIIIPSALDKTETTIIAASLETIDKIGPTDASITIKEIEDVRGSKRDYIMERAKKLLGEIKGQGMDSGEMHSELLESQRTSKISEYGDEKLPAGDLTGNEVIVVEGRADVVNMLKYGIKNVIGMNGTKLPKEISKLGEAKELTLFVDGDRGGKLIAKNVCDNAKVVFIASAPDGKEVEELVGKEIMQALRKKIPASEFFQERKTYRDDRRSYRNERSYDDREKSYEKEEKPKEKSSKVLTSDDKKKIRELASELKGKNALLLNSNLEIIKNVPVSKLNFLKADDVLAVVVSNATSGVIAGAEDLNAKYVVAQSFTRIPETDIELISI